VLVPEFEGVVLLVNLCFTLSSLDMTASAS